MKKYILLLFAFFPFVALPVSNIYVVQDSVALRSDKIDNNTNIIKSLSKDTQLQLLTMHYSGWSKVSLGDLTGWVLSESLTKTVPESFLKNTDAKKVQSLQKILLRLKSENNALIAKITDIKAINDKKITELSSSLAELKTQNSIDLQPTLSVESSSLRDKALLFIVGLVAGFVISFIVLRIVRRKQNKLNVISRSY